MVHIKVSPDGVEAGSLLPPGQRWDEQLRMVYTQITKNAPMDLKNAMFIAHTFRVSPYVVRDVYNRHYLDTKRLTRAQFVHVMREAMNKSGVSGGGLTDRSRDLHRSFSISDAPVDSPRPPATDRPVMATKRLAVDSVRDGYRERGDARNKLADSIRSLESTILVRKTQRGSPLTPSMTSRFVDGSITARRVPTACYLPSRRNLTLVAKRPTTTDARAANVRGNGGNIMGFFGKTPFARDSYGESPGHIWGTRMEAESAQRQKSASVNGMRPRTAAEMGRTAKCDRDMTKMGRTAKCDLDMTKVTDGEDTQQQAREFVDYLSAGLRKRNAQRADLLMLFEHFDQNKTEHVSLEHARLVFAELDCILSLSALREVAMVANALGQDESVNYKKLSDALIPLFSGSKSTSTRNPALDKKIVRKSPQALHKALAHLAFLAWNHRHEIFRQTSGRQNERVQKTFAEQVRALDHNDDGTCQLPDLKIVLMGMGLSPGEIDTISDYLVAESNKTGQRGGQQSVVYPLLLRMIHTEMTMRDKIAGWDSCPVFPAGPARKIMPKQTSILDITEPSERRRTGLAAVYKKVNAEVRSTAKLCTIFENLDPANEGVVSLDAFHLALGKLCVRLSEDETQILMEQLDPKKSGRVDYSKFIALMLPAEMLKEDALGYTSVIRKGKNCGPGSLEASINAMANLSSDEILTILRNGCVRALAEGPQSLKQEYSIFKIPHDARISSRNISRFVQDFGLHLSDHQCQALFNKIDSKNDGFVNYYDFMKKVLPPDASIQEGAAKRGVASEIAEDDFHEGMTARLRRQLLRKSIKGLAPGVQLRNAFGSLLHNEVTDGEILGALLDHGIIVDRDELTKYLKPFRSQFSGRVSVPKFIEALEPQAYEYVFPSFKDVGAGALTGVKKEVNLGDRERDPHMFEGIWLPLGKFTNYNRIGHRTVSDQEIRNCLRKALASRIAHDGAQTNIYAELRACDASQDGNLGVEQFRAFLYKIGLKVEAEGNLERLWHCIAGGAERLDIMALAEVLTSQFEHVPRKPRETIREKFAFR